MCNAHSGTIAHERVELKRVLHDRFINGLITLLTTLNASVDVSYVHAGINF